MSKQFLGSMLINVAFVRTCQQQSICLVKHVLYCPSICGCDLYRCEKVLNIFMVFVLISCFELVFLRKAFIGCILLNVSLTLLVLLMLMLNMWQCLFIISFT